MRDFKGMKRQRGRNRGGGGGGKPQQNANRAFDSNGPDGVKVRGNAQHVFEKYQQLARDANASGDRVLAENYLQHAEHYFRLLRAIQPNRPPSEIIGRDQFASGYDIDFEDESGQQAQALAAEEAAQDGGGEPRDDGDFRQQDRNRDRGERDRGGDWQARDRDRDGGGRRDGWRDRDRNRDRDRDRPRDDRPRDDRPRDERRDDRPREDRYRDDRDRRDDRPRDERPRDERPRDDDRRDRYERRDREEREERPSPDPLAVVQPQGDEPRPGAFRDEGEHSNVPAFLRPTRPPAGGAPAPAAEAPAAEEKPRTRRRRAPRSFEGGGEGAPEAEEA
jgi:hypothetical protein